MRKFWLLPAIAFAVCLNAATVFAYGYAEAEDPMVKVFQSAVVAAKEGRWGEVSELADKGIAMQKGHLFEADKLAPRIKESTVKKDVSKTAKQFANLVYLSIREKLHRNIKESFSDYKSGKARLRLARKAYIDVLDGNVKKQDAGRSRSILSQFDTALKSIGNPGLFGMGKKEPDKAGYEQAVNKIEALIVVSFPSFAK
ncbi:MAG: hypothetical protein ACE5EN_04955 [Nitrospinota bacterium]